MIKLKNILEATMSTDLDTYKIADSFTPSELKQLKADGKISGEVYNGAIELQRSWKQSHPTMRIGGGAYKKEMVKKLNESKLNERFEFRKDDVHQIQGKTNSMQEFVKHIKNLPEELGSIKMPTETISFNPDQIEFKKKFTSSDKAKVLKILRDLSIEFKKKKDPIYEYEISSYYGTIGKQRTPAEDNFYISFRTKKHDDFGEFMRSGRGGSLD